MYNTYNQEIRRYFTTVARPSFIPAPIPEWQLGRTLALEEVKSMADVMLKTFFPPIHLFFGVEPSKRAAMLSRLVSLWPTLQIRVSLARSDPQVQRLGTQEWRDLLSDSYFKRQWPRDEPFQLDAFYRYGGASVFGQQVSEDLRAGASFVPHPLECRCDATVTRLVDDRDLMASIVFRLTLESLKHDFAYVAHNVLRDAGLPVLSDIGGEYVMPDFCFGNDRQSPTVAKIMKSIENIVQLNFQGQPGWILESDDGNERAKWVGSLRAFLTEFAPDPRKFKYFERHAEVTVEAMKTVWLNTTHSHKHAAAVKKLEIQLLYWWFAVRMHAGRWPVELLPPPIFRTWRCADCRERAPALEELGPNVCVGFPDDDDDDYDDDGDDDDDNDKDNDPAEQAKRSRRREKNRRRRARQAEKRRRGRR